MSETTLTKDTIQTFRDRPLTIAVQRGLSHVLLTDAERIKLCDAAERAETLEAQLTEVTRELERWNKCDSLVCPYEQRALAAEAALAPLRAVVEDLRSWLFEQFDMFKGRDSASARAVAASFRDVIVKLDDLSALPADPSAPTPR